MTVAALIFAGSATASGQTAETTLYLFGSQSGDGIQPAGPVIFDKAGNLYGTTASGGKNNCGAVFELVPPATPGGAWTETLLYSFTCGLDGQQPSSGLVFDSRGSLYGETLYGGYNITGTVFKLTPPTAPGGIWEETTIYDFCSAGNPCVDGARPSGGLVFDKNGNLYGTATIGGNPTTGCCGVVFKLTHSASGWTETVLHTFLGNYFGQSDGYSPQTGVIFDTTGNLYGTTAAGGDYSCGGGVGNGGCGAVFELTPTAGGWTESILYSFHKASDGIDPQAGLVIDKSGALYGTTSAYGGLTNGTVYELSPPAVQGGAWTESVLYSFQGLNNGGTDGSFPVAGVVFSGKNLLGTTAYGGSALCGLNGVIGGCGTVFRLSPPKSGTGAWSEKILWNFASGGAYPEAALNLKGVALYGTASSGGVAGQCGAVFELSPATSTSTTLASSLNPSTYGQALIFTAMVTSADGAPPDGEIVTFKKGASVLGTGTLSGGSATLAISTLGVGANAVTAVYAGDGNFAASTSKPVSQVISKATSTTSLTSSQNPSTFGQSVTFTATVAPQFGGIPTGTVTFQDGTKILRTVKVSAGAANLTISTLAAGAHDITATYNGSASFVSSSASLTQTVN
jgi:uncharacterized repeat protein (TIGR03803 family)